MINIAGFVIALTCTAVGVLTIWGLLPPASDAQINGTVFVTLGYIALRVTIQEPRQ